MSHVSYDELIGHMSNLRDSGTPFVVATVIRTEGSTPRKVGAKMIVAADGRLFGTIGGGAVESRIIEEARELIDRPEVRRFEWRLSDEEAGGMICGGAMEFLLEPFVTRPRAFIFGAGHCGQALARILLDLRFEVYLVDPRDGLGNEPAGAHRIQEHPGDFAAGDKVPRGAYCVIANPTHQYDLETLRGLVGKDLEYLGLMSSRRKKAEVFGILAFEGVTADRLAMVHCPVGLDIGAETPEEIAVAIAAEMVSVLRHEGRSKPAEPLSRHA